MKTIQKKIARALFDVCLPFEKPIVELEKKILELKESSSAEVDFSAEVKSLEKKLEKSIRETFQDLTPWQRVQVARHPLRPYTLDYIEHLVTDFFEIHGDRRFSDDAAIIAGIGKWKKTGDAICVIGHQKGRDTKQNLERSFGSAHPEGYRKALRVMQLAEKGNMPILCLIDTPGAFPGVGAEERGQSEAIAVNLREMGEIRVPIIVVVIGEGGSGGALGIGVGDEIAVMENAYYSVISPEGCAAILWKESGRFSDAAEALKLTAKDLQKLGLIDAAIPEPLGGAHRDYAEAAENIEKFVTGAIEKIRKISKKELLEHRYQKFRKMGVFSDATA